VGNEIILTDEYILQMQEKYPDFFSTEGTGMVCRRVKNRRPPKDSDEISLAE
jgi:hypothetical protein